MDVKCNGNDWLSHGKVKPRADDKGLASQRLCIVASFYAERGNAMAKSVLHGEGMGKK
jgi:hypothetical protein